MLLETLRAWWSAPADYEGMVAYLQRRGLGRPAQALIAACAATLGAVPIAIQFSPAGPNSTFGRTISVVFAVLALLWAIVWLLGPWPSRRWSILFVIFADVGIAVISLQDSDPLTGMYGTSTFVLVSVYAIFFEGPKLIAVHTLFVTIVILLFAYSLATGPDGDLGLAAAKALASIAGIAATPPAVQIGIWVLRNEANESGVDPLTRLLNRRGLELQIADLDLDSGTEVVAIVADLDNFKAVNDSSGHAVGDEVLIRTARRIRSIVRGTAVVARLGGEEFVVVDVVDAGDAWPMAERIRTRIGAPADRAPITASLGIASVSCSEFAAGRNSLETLVQRADYAMYEAKRNGRDATVVADTPS